MTTPAKRMKVMEAKSFHGLSLLEPEKSSPVIIHAVAAVIPIARSVAGQRSLYLMWTHPKRIHVLFRRSEML